MNRFKVLIAPLVLLLSTVFLLSLIGLPKPSFEKIANKKPTILPSDAEVLEYKQEERWEIKLDDKLVSVKDLVIEVINLNNFKSYKRSKSPIKIKRQDGKIVVKKKKDADEKISDVILAIAKPRSGKRVSWEKSYLVHLKPRVIFVDVENRNDKNTSDSERDNSNIGKFKEQTGDGEKEIVSSEEFIFGKPKPSQSPSNECEFSVDDNITEGTEGFIIVDYTPSDAKVLSASISNVRATHRKPVNISRSTHMTFTKNIDQEFALVSFVTKNAKWYGVSKKPPFENLCSYHNDQSEYEALIKIKIRKPNGEICNFNAKHTFTVNAEREVAFMGPLARNTSHNSPVRVIQNTSSRCCVEIQPQPSPILVKSGLIINEFQGQYKKIAQKEEERHQWQWINGSSWNKGGYGQEPTNERIYDKLRKRKFCARKKLFEKKSSLCTRAARDASKALWKAADKTHDEVIKFLMQKTNLCWVEYTAKRDIGLDETVAHGHYACAKAGLHREPSERCPVSIKQPPFLPPVNLPNEK